jgi:hypothetical protein
VTPQLARAGVCLLGLEDGAESEPAPATVAAHWDAAYAQGDDTRSWFQKQLRFQGADAANESIWSCA